MRVKACLIERADLESPPPAKRLHSVELRSERAAGLVVEPIAVGICYSDAKIFEFGTRNPRVRRGLDENGWIIPGHEVLFRVVAAVGDSSFRAGEFVHAQPSARFAGRKHYLGFTRPGGLATRTLLGEEFLESDDGGNLLSLGREPPPPSLALLEPWSCVEADLASGIDWRDAARRRVVLGAGEWSRRVRRAAASASGAAGEPRPAGHEAVAAGSVAEPPCDVTILGDEVAAEVEIAVRLAKGSSIALDPSEPTARVRVDLHHLHYGRQLFAGARRMAELRAAGRWSLAGALTGRVVLYGGAGPLGQMYLKRMLLAGRSFERLTVVDRLEGRLRRVAELLRGWRHAGAERVDLVRVPQDADPAAGVRFAAAALDHRPETVIVFCPSRRVVATSVLWVADRGLVNVFAGMPPGSWVEVAPADLARGVSLYGRSGSSIAESRLALERVLAEQVDLADFVVRTVPLESAWSALLAVRKRQVCGKVLVV